jgi:hypothetical protein
LVLELQICRTHGAVKIIKTEYVPPTEIGRQRHAWFKEHVEPGMTFDEIVRLNDEALNLFPPTEEERRLKSESLKDIPEFVLCPEFVL